MSKRIIEMNVIEFRIRIIHKRIFESMQSKYANRLWSANKVGTPTWLFRVPVNWSYFRNVIIRNNETVYITCVLRYVVRDGSRDFILSRVSPGRNVTTLPTYSFADSADIAKLFHCFYILLNLSDFHAIKYRSTNIFLPIKYQSLPLSNSSNLNSANVMEMLKRGNYYQY